MNEPTKTAAILGASANRAKFGNKSVRAHVRAGYHVFPVNPRGGEIEGLPVATSLAEIDQPLDRISVYLPPPLALATLDEIAACGCGELWLNPGCDTPEVTARAQELGLNVVAACSIVDVGFSPAEFGD